MCLIIMQEGSRGEQRKRTHRSVIPQKGRTAFEISKTFFFVYMTFESTVTLGSPYVFLSPVTNNLQSPCGHPSTDGSKLLHPSAGPVRPQQGSSVLTEHVSFTERSRVLWLSLDSCTVILFTWVSVCVCMLTFHHLSTAARGSEPRRRPPGPSEPSG